MCWTCPTACWRSFQVPDPTVTCILRVFVDGALVDRCDQPAVGAGLSEYLDFVFELTI